MHKNTLNFKELILEGYSRAMLILFYIFLFCVLSFGRAFSVFCVQTPLSPFFVTEFFLLLNIPFLFYKYKSLARLPRLFLTPTAIFFILGYFYLSAGLLKQNLFALRDITVFGYILFLPIAFIHLNSLKRVKYLIFLVVFSNIINLYSRQCLMLGIFSSETLRNFMFGFKSHNMGLYFGIENAFIIALYGSIKSRIVRLLALIVLSLNICMLILFSSSSLWLSAIVSFVFLFLMLKERFLKLFLFFVPVFILTGLIVFNLDFKCESPTYWEKITDEVKGINLFFNNVFSRAKPAKKAPAKISSANKSPQVKSAKQAPAEVTPVNPPPQEKPAQQASAKISPAAMSFQNKSVKTSPATNEIDPAFSNINWRLNIWRQTIKFTMDSPLFGKGFGVYPVYKIWCGFQSPQHIFTGSDIVPPHNHLLTVFLKMGILGLGLFLFINIYVFAYALAYIKKCNLRLINNLLIALLGALVFWQTFALFFDIIDSPPTSVFLWAIMGFIFGAVEIDKNSLRV